MPLAAGWLKPFNRFGDRQGKALTQFTGRLIERMNGAEATLEGQSPDGGS